MLQRRTDNKAAGTFSGHREEGTKEGLGHGLLWKRAKPSVLKEVRCRCREGAL